MQTVMQASGLYGALKDLEGLLDEYARAKESDPARAHTLEHMITAAVREGGIAEETRLPETGGETFLLHRAGASASWSDCILPHSRRHAHLRGGAAGG